MEECCSGKKSLPSDSSCHTFAQLIQQVQLMRNNRANEPIQEKRIIKQNIMKAYLNRKLIIPSFLNEKYKTNSVFDHQSDKEQKQNKDQVAKPQFTKRKIQTALHQKRSKLKSIDYNNVDKWKLQISCEEKNSLLFGKQIKIGSKLRRALLSDEQIYKIKLKFEMKHKNKINTMHTKFLKLNLGKSQKKKENKLSNSFHHSHLINQESNKSNQDFIIEEIKSPKVKFKIRQKYISPPLRNI